MSREVPVRYDVAGTARIGIVHLPAEPARQGVLIVVGGWQYRVGSHRLFVLLARALAEAGTAVMRFDSRGMGDSEGESGEPEPAEHLEPDIRASLDAFAEQAPGVREFTLCGLCDGASAALMYAPLDPRVRRLVLLNPWLSSPQGAARSMLRHYYLDRLREPEFWRKLAAGRLDIAGALHSLRSNVLAARRMQPAEIAAAAPDPVAEAGARVSQRMARALDEFEGHILLVLSGRDLTARQYADAVAASARWQALLRNGQAERIDMPEADHTFSRRVFRDAVAAHMIGWLGSGPGRNAAGG